MNAAKTPKGIGNLLYVAPARFLDLPGWHEFIAASLKATGTLPEELADLISVECLEAYNEDGSNRYVLRWI